MFSAGFIASFIGAIIGVAAFGNLVAYGLRKFTPIGLIASYAAGVGTMVAIGILMKGSQPELQIQYAMAGILVFSIMAFRSRKTA